MKARTRKTHPIHIPSSRWLAYAGAGAATTLASIGSADAEIHYSGAVNVRFQPDQNKVARLEIEPGAFLLFRHDKSFSDGVGADFFHAEGQVAGAFRGYYVGFEYAYVSRLRGDSDRYISQGYFIADKGGYYFGTMINGGQDTGPWGPRGGGFVGFRFDNGAGRQYGWARVRMAGPSKNFAFEVVDYAWADPGESIKPGQTSSSAGAVPAQGSLGLLAAGAVGVALWRQRRRRGSDLAA